MFTSSANVCNFRRAINCMKLVEMTDCDCTVLPVYELHGAVLTVPTADCLSTSGKCD